jgi:hypothetical protein
MDKCCRSLRCNFRKPSLSSSGKSSNEEKSEDEKQDSARKYEMEDKNPEISAPVRNYESSVRVVGGSSNSYDGSHSLYRPAVLGDTDSIHMARGSDGIMRNQDRFDQMRGSRVPGGITQSLQKNSFGGGMSMQRTTFKSRF